jgi:hypothetical protein
METYKLVLVLIIHTAALLLVIFYVYPQLKKFFRHKISISIRIGTEEKGKKEKTVPPKKQEKFPSILGKTKFVLSQPLPNAATDLETENRTEKEDTFAPETRKPEDENINYETGEGIEVPEENEEAANVDLGEELEDLGVGNVSEDRAGGVDYNNLGRTAKTISDPKDSSPADEDLAGKVLSENQYTQLVKSMQDARPEYAQRITELIDRYGRKLLEGQNQEVKTSQKKQKLYESEDFKNFNIDEIS